MSKSFNITKEEVAEAWKAVKQAAGGAGLDNKTIAQVESNLENELYKIWNRMSSGSYLAQAVKLVQIPKAKGGFRTLGIPNVTDRVAQTVIKNRLEQVVDPLFHEDSYAYRPGKSAKDAILKARKRCFDRLWVVEIDIKGFFDNLDHELMMDILQKYITDKSTLLYSQRFLKADGITEKGEVLKRGKGTPQGGVVSPILANLYLHEAFDKWMKANHQNITFERYADDIVVHCVTEKQAKFMRDVIGARLQKYKLEMHPEKTRIVYAGISNDFDDRGHGLHRKFTFLGYDFKPRKCKGGTVFSPGMGQGALLNIRLKIKDMKLDSLTHKTVESIAEVINKVSSGWITYYGYCRKSLTYKIADEIDKRIIKWIGKKYKIRSHGKKWKAIQRLKTKKPKLFKHWIMVRGIPLRAV